MFSLYDYETRGRENLPAVGHHVYFSSAEILMVACGNETGDPWLQPVIGSLDTSSVTPVSWGRFDYHCYDRLEFPHESTDWVDAMALAQYIGFPAGLNAFATAIGIENKKDPRGARLIKLYSIPRDDGTFRELEGDDKEAFEAYALQDLVLLQHNWRVLKPLWLEWEEVCRPQYEAVEKMNETGVPIDRESAAKALSLVEDFRETKTQEFQALVGFNPTQVAKITEFLELPDCTKDTLEAASFDDPVKEAVRTTRLAVSATAPDKLKPMIRMSRMTGRCHGMWVPNGAHTGRMSCRKPQFHNMVREAYDPAYFEALETGAEVEDPVGATRSNIRGFIKPEPGHVLVVADYSQIEPRLLANASGCDKLVKAFTTPGMDPYKMMFAAHEDIKDWRTVDGAGRTVGKLLVIAPGYGAGARGVCRQAPGYGLDLDLADAGRLVTTFRTRLPEIPNFWSAIGSSARAAVLGAADIPFGGGGRFDVEGEFLCLRLPSGRSVRYYRPKPIAGSEESVSFLRRYGTKFFRRELWGGLITENYISALAADVQLNAIERLQKRWEVIAAVHDETALHVKAPEAESALEYMLEVMATPPSWVPEGLLVGEGGIVERYTKL